MTKVYLVTVGSITLGAVDNKYKISNLVKAYYVKRLKDAASNDYADLMTELNDCITNLKMLDTKLSSVIWLEDGGFFSWGHNNNFVVRCVSVFDEDSGVDLVKCMYNEEVEE